MQIDFRLPREWAATNEKVAAVLAPPAGFEVYTFQNIQSAVVEAVFGLSQLYAHKKKLFYIKNINPLFESAVMVLAKMGYIVTPLDARVLEEPSGFASSIDREVLLILFAADDPLLGRRFQTAKLEEALREKPVMQVRVSHNAHFFDGLSASPPRTSVHLYSVGQDGESGAVGVVGERARFGVLTSDQVTNRFAHDQINVSWAKSPLQSSEEKIKDFEAKKVAEGAAVLAGPRVFDRAVIAWPDMDGHALITKLSQRLRFALAQPGRETRLETTSLSRWGGVRTMDFLLAQGFSPEIIRGLVMIAADLINPELEKHLVEIRRQLLSEQFAGEQWATPNV